MASQPPQRKLSILRGSKLDKIKAANAIGYPITDAAIDAAAKELVDSTVQSFEEALQQATPAEREAASKISDVFAEFIAGFRQGVQAELVVIKQERKQVGDAAFAADNDDEHFDLLKSIDEGIKQLAEAAENQDKSVSEVHRESKEEKHESISVEKYRESKNESSSFLQRMKADASWDGKIPLAARAQQYTLAAVGGLTGFVGGGAFADRKIEEIQKREEFVSTESKLRAQQDPEGFGKLSSKEQRKQLLGDYKGLQQTEKELTDLEAQAERLRERGYSEEDVELSLGYAEKREPLVEKVRELDRSRASKPQEETATNNTPIGIALGATSGGSSDSSQAISNVGGDASFSTAEVQPQTFSASAAEETKAESDRLLEAGLAEQRQQTITLLDIREILSDTLANAKESRPQDAATAANQGGSVLDSVGDLLDGGGKSKPGGKVPGKAPGIKGALRGAAKLPILGAALSLGIGAYEGYQGWTQADDDAKSKGFELDELESQGLVSKEEAAAKRKEISVEETENKGGSVGKGLGVFAGSVAGMKAGAMLGSLLGPVGMAVGGLAGGAIGGIAGSSVGQNIGGAIGHGVGAISNWFGGDSVNKSSQLSVNNAAEAKESVTQRTSMESEVLREKTLALESEKQSAPNITVQAPPATVINNGDDKTKVVNQPFSTRIRVKEPSLSDYLRSRYSPA